MAKLDDESVDEVEKSVDKVEKSVDKVKRKLDKVDDTIRKSRALVERAQLIVTTLMNLLTSVAVVVSVLLGAKNIDVSGQQLDIAQQQIENSKSLAETVGKSNERGAAWEEALEAMQIDQAIASEHKALVRRFEPPEVLIWGQPPTPVHISVQSLANEPLKARIEGQVLTEGWPLICQLPGCVELGSSECQCHNPLHYEFVIEGMHEYEVELPIALHGDEGSCPKRAQLQYTIQIQDEKGRMQTLATRKTAYQRSGRGKAKCAAGLEYRFAADDTWAGEPVTEESVAAAGSTGDGAGGESTGGDKGTGGGAGTDDGEVVIDDEAGTG